MLDKSRIGLIFKTPRASREVQDSALREAGASWIVEIGQIARTWRMAVTAVREGDLVFIYALSLVPTKRGQDELSPSAQVADFLVEVHERGGIVVEVMTGRKSNDRSARRKMIAEAHKALRRGSRALPAIGRKRGRPKLVWTDDQLDTAKRVWLSRDYTTNAAAAKHLPKGFTAKRAWELFGPSGRPFTKRKRR